MGALSLAGCLGCAATGGNADLRLAAYVAGGLAVAALFFAFAVLPWLRARSRRQEQDQAKVRPVAALPGVPPLRVLANTRAHLGEMAAQSRVDVVAMLDYAIRQAHAAGASDIHLSPMPDGVQVALRLDGLLYDLALFSADVRHASLIRVKVLSKLNVYKRDVPQDGRILFSGEKPIDIRVSIIPTIHGEKTVLRFLGRSLQPYTLENLGMEAEMLPRYRALCSRPQGLILVTGPTGSGKTTTMYASLDVARARRGTGINVVTIEDPVEYVVPQFNQTQVNEEAGLTFAVGLRSLLRQDPNILMVGEIRDKETMEIAMQAGLTGHLIFTTVHAESSAGVFTRLLNMGVEPFVLASASAAVVGQRLVRKICSSCRKEVPPEPHQVEQLRRLEVEDKYFEGPYFRGAGCDHCLGMGVAGRTGMFELLEVNDEVRELVVKVVPTHELHAAAIRGGLRSLLLTGLERARAGQISLEEVLSVVGV
jgi:general secretion pathway protein E